MLIDININDHDPDDCRRKMKPSKTKHEHKVRHEDLDIQANNEFVVMEPEVEDFHYSPEGLVRLIKLDLGINDEHEFCLELNTVEERTSYNIRAEEQFDPPSKKMFSSSIEERKKEEMGRDPRDVTEVQEISTKMKARQKDFECVRKYEQAEEKKKVMGMSDSHIVTDYVYQLTIPRYVSQ